jgi:hypothetical protein
MISTRILDNDMGAVLKVPLSGRGTIHGVTIVIDGIALTELDVGLLEIISADRGVPRFAEHAKQLNNPDIEKHFVEAYTNWVSRGKK